MSRQKRRENIDRILNDWAYAPGEVLAREVVGEDGRTVLQMRLEMGLLQMEVDGRPDGERPEDFDTYYEYLIALAEREDGNFQLNREQCVEIDREFVQFYHRRVCWLTLRQFARATADADHTLALMDFSVAHAPDEDWSLSHEQYRPFVMFHRIQAAALAQIEGDGDGESAIGEIDAGLGDLQVLFEQWDTDEAFEDNELTRRLMELRRSLRDEYEIEPSLIERLSKAIAAEEYELAAKIRDTMDRRKNNAE